MKLNLKGRSWAIVAVVIAILFISCSLSLIYSVRGYQKEIGQNVILLANLDDLNRSIQELNGWHTDGFSLGNPVESEIEWQLRYTEYWSKTGKFIGNNS